MADTAQQDNPNVLTDQNGTPVQNGSVPQDDGATNSQSLVVDANGTENFDISFSKGNYSQIKGLPQVVATKVNALTKTFVPLIEVALIELTGSSEKYKRIFGQVTPSFDSNSNLSLDFNFQYSIPGYIGTDFEYSDLQTDSKYIYDRLMPSGVNVTKCEINTADGLVTIVGSL